MATAVKAAPVTPADELRTSLAEAEGRLPDLSGRESVERLYATLDHISVLWPELEGQGADLRSEDSRWKAVQTQLRNRGPQVLRAWGGSRELAEARPEASTSGDQWWWWLDQAVAQDRQRSLLRILTITVAALALVGVGLLLAKRLFPVDPQVRATYQLQIEAESAMARGDYQIAFDRMAQAVQVSPERADLWITHGALAEVLDQPAVAADAWSKGRSLLAGDEAAFLTHRSLAFLKTNLVQQGIHDAEAAVAMDPQSAQAYYTLGLGYETAGQSQAALKAYTRASDLAGNEDPQLTVLARSRMAGLLRGMQLSPPTAPAP